MEGSLRLVDGLGPHDGRVEVYHFGQWGTVDISSWDLHDASVVCHHLGYPTAVATKAFTCKSAPVWLSSVQCTGLESNLTQCRNGLPRLGTCSRSFGLSNAGVVCSTASK